MSNPPSGYTVASGTWGVDLDYNTSVYCASKQSVEFKNTGTEGELIGDSFSVSPGQTLRVHGIARAASIAVGNDLYLAVGWYDAAGALLSVSMAFGPAPLSLVNTWLDVGSVVAAPLNAASARVALGKEVGGGFTAYWNAATADPMTPSAKIYVSANYGLAAPPASAIVDFDTSSYDFGGFVYLPDHCFIIPADGYYRVNLVISATNAAPGTTVMMTPVLLADADFYWGPNYMVQVSTSQRALWTWEGPLSRGQKVKGYLSWTGGTNTWQINGGAQQTYMTISEIRM